MVPEAPLPPGEILEFTFGQVMVGWIEAHGQLYYFGHHDELSLLMNFTWTVVDNSLFDGCLSLLKDIRGCPQGFITKKLT